MNIEDLKQRCLDSIDKETQLKKASELAKDRPMEFYHRGRKEVFLYIHSTLVIFFKGVQK